VLGHAWVTGRSIRVRLTLWYVVLLGLILVAFSGFLYLSLYRSLHDELDRSLLTEAQRQTATLDYQNFRFGQGPDNLELGIVAALQGIGLVIGPYIGGALWEQVSHFAPFLAAGASMTVGAALSLTIRDE